MPESYPMDGVDFTDAIRFFGDAASYVVSGFSGSNIQDGVSYYGPDRAVSRQ